VRNGYLVTEAYWHPYGPNDTHSIESITKSVIGTLIGIALDQGAIRNVDQKLLDFFPQQAIQNLDGRKKSITLHDLLSMTPGLDWEDAKSLDRVIRSDDWIHTLLDLPMATKPSSKWIYCNGASHLLSAVLQEATGMDARSYANQHLFAALGIPQASERGWGSDPQGITNGIAGLYLTPRDLAKFGFLYLNLGQWNGQSVVPADWVKESTREQSYIGEDEYVGGLDRRFGYLWSIFPDQNYYVSGQRRTGIIRSSTGKYSDCFYRSVGGRQRRHSSEDYQRLHRSICAF
jgi:CubicO group peptidase (beta-lactamase class C family)